ncbi:UNVERIFIED_CONTAM: hypothetical protein Sangu_0899500 [Sesamum angustifolium]|uniref:Uncharacterized protein n=1 Tax=Sesamum angustifolium TaxID=2727405 RepID=A0AAW2PBB2_9LAMI
MSDINLEMWFEAIKSEMDSMCSNQVWTLLDRPKGVKLVGCKWVYKRKISADGEVTTFKARLVSSKQDTTTDSITEVEYIAALEEAKETVWMKNYIQELGAVPSITEVVVIFCDNIGAIAQAKKSRSHHRSKHILRRYHMLREMVERGDVRIYRVNLAENTEDPLTKPASQITHSQHLGKMGLKQMSD